MRRLLLLFFISALSLSVYAQDLLKTKTIEFSATMDSIYSDTLFSKINVVGQCPLRTENLVVEKVFIDKLTANDTIASLGLFLKTSHINLIKSGLLSYEDAIKKYYPLYQTELNYFKYFPQLNSYDIIPLEMEDNPTLIIMTLELFFSHLNDSSPLQTFKRLKPYFKPKDFFKTSDGFIDSLNLYFGSQSTLWENLKKTDNTLQLCILQTVEAATLSKKFTLSEKTHTAKTIAFANQNFKKYYKKENSAVLFVPLHWLKNKTISTLNFTKPTSFFVTRYLSSKNPNKETCGILKKFFKMKKKERSRMASKKLFTVRRNGTLIHAVAITTYQ